MECAARFKALASSSTPKRESVNAVMKDISLRMVNASNRITPHLITSDVPYGIREFVRNALRDGISMLKMFAPQSVIFVHHGRTMENVHHVTMDTLFKMEHVLWIMT
jgi:hypothetical protein